MFQNIFKRLIDFQNNKDLLTIWINNLIVVYAFFIPVNATVKSKIFIIILALFLIRGNVWKQIKEAFSNKVVQAFFYFFAVYFIWLIGTDDFHLAYRNITHIKHVIYILVFYILIDGRYINKIFGAFIFGMLLSELISYAMFFGIIPWEFTLWNTLLYKAYAIGDPVPFTHHIHYGVLLTITVVLLFQRILYSQASIWTKYLMSIFMLTASINIFVTGGRTGYVSFLLIILFLSIIYLKKWIIPIIMGLLIFGFTLYSNSEIMQAKVNQTVSAITKVSHGNKDFNSSFGARLGLLYYGADVIKDNWLVGVGTGDSFPEISKRLPEKDSFLGNQKVFQHEHNVYLSVLLQFGLIGFLVFLNIYYQIIRFNQNEKDLRMIQLAVTFIFAIAFLTEMFEMRIFLPLWTLILATTMRSRSHHVISDVNIPSDNRMIKQMLLLGVICYIVFRGIDTLVYTT